MTCTRSITNLAWPALQDSSLSGMTDALQILDSLHTAYLQWPHLLRSLLAQAVPALLPASPAQLLHLKHSLQQADSNADGLLTQPEWLSVDIASLLTTSAGASAATDVASAAEADAGSSGTDVNTASAPDTTDVSSQEQQAAQDTAEAQSSSEQAASSDKTAEDLKQLLFEVLKSNSDTEEVISAEGVLLYLCGDIDGRSGLRKAFALLAGNEAAGQVQQFLLTMTALVSKKCYFHVELP